jgi:hypothetical protein
MSTIKFGMEITDAIIVGDDFKTGQLFYEWRAQGGRFHGENDGELRTKAKAMRDELRTRWTPAWFDGHFTDSTKWELRIWD